MELGTRTHIMGVLNVTPDSFYDGGRYVDTRQAVRRCETLIEEGADIIDVGGESTRPGSERVSAEEELSRILPVIRALSGAAPILISVDTMKAEVAESALEAGAHIINDVSAFRGDARMVNVAMDSGAGVILMHMQGEPRTMQRNPRYHNVLSEVCTYLGGRVQDLAHAGLARECMAIDPGIGFGKTLEHNLQLLAGLNRLGEFGRPVVVGASRKSFLGWLTGREPPDRLAAGLGAMAAAIMRGAHIIRTHDVKESCDVARVLDKIRQQEFVCRES